jgi:hypothetical protein
MIDFFIEGGWSMWPVLLIGGVLAVTAGRYMLDREPVRLRLIMVLSLALLAVVAQGILSDVAQVMWVLARENLPPGLGQQAEPAPMDVRMRILMEGMKESMAPGILGLGLLALSLILVAIGVYLVGRRELEATRG